MSTRSRDYTVDIFGWEVGMGIIILPTPSPGPHIHLGLVTVHSFSQANYLHNISPFLPLPLFTFLCPKFLFMIFFLPSPEAMLIAYKRQRKGGREVRRETSM